METIWSPWRMEYIENNEHASGCVFCTELTKPDGPNNLVVHRGKRAFVILNRFPYTSGHLMVVPIEHQPDLEKLDPETRADIIELETKAIRVLREVYHPEGFNLGANIGRAAGAGIADHMHFHIVPRWPGDTNFMSTVGHTRVLPESLEETYQRVKSVWDQMG